MRENQTPTAQIPRKAQIPILKPKKRLTLEPRTLNFELGLSNFEPWNLNLPRPAPPMSSPLFPTSVVGSLPRPAFVLDLINDRPPVSPEQYRHEMQAAVRYAVAMQEHA